MCVNSCLLELGTGVWQAYEFVCCMHTCADKFCLRASRQQHLVPGTHRHAHTHTQTQTQTNTHTQSFLMLFFMCAS